MSSVGQLTQDNAEYQWHPMANPAALKKVKPDIVARGPLPGAWRGQRRRAGHADDSGGATGVVVSGQTPGARCANTITRLPQSA